MHDVRLLSGTGKWETIPLNLHGRLTRYAALTGGVWWINILAKYRCSAVRELTANLIVYTRCLVSCGVIEGSLVNQ